MSRGVSCPRSSPLARSVVRRRFPKFRTRLLTPVLVAVLLANAVAVVALAAVLLGRPAAAADPAVGAKAYARVYTRDGKPVLDAARSRNVLGVSEPTEGTICLTLAVAVENVVASGNAGISPVFAFGGVCNADGGNAICPEAAKAFARTYNGATNAPQTAPFYVVMH